MVDYSAELNNPRFCNILLAYKENPRLFTDIVYKFLGQELSLERGRRGYDIQEAADKLGIGLLHLKMMENGDQRFSFINYLNLLDTYNKLDMTMQEKIPPAK